MKDVCTKLQKIILFPFVENCSHHLNTHIDRADTWTSAAGGRVGVPPSSRIFIHGTDIVDRGL